MKADTLFLTEGQGHVGATGPSGLIHRHHLNDNAPHAGAADLFLAAMETQTRFPISLDKAGIRCLPAVVMMAHWPSSTNRKGGPHRLDEKTRQSRAFGRRGKRTT